MPFSFYQRHATYTRTLVEKLFTWPLNWAEQKIVPPLLWVSLRFYLRGFTGGWGGTSISSPRSSGGRPKRQEGIRGNARLRRRQTHLWRSVWRYVILPLIAGRQALTNTCLLTPRRDLLDADRRR